MDGLQLLAASTLLRLPVLREAVAAHIPVTASSLQRTLEHARTYASAVLQERCAEFLAEHFGSTAAAALATSTASMVASVLDATAQQTAETITPPSQITVRRIVDALQVHMRFGVV